MSLKRAEEYLENKGFLDHVIELEESTATVVMAAGHMKSVTVLYTAEIELRPVIGGTIKRKYDPETGTGFWDF